MSPILDHRGNPVRARRVRLSEEQARPRIVRVVDRRGVRATYDAAQTTDENTRHWAATDALSADEANSYAVRKKLRERARYEITNNGYAQGIVNVYAYDVVGTGPRLQLLTDEPALNSDVERRWRQWARKVRLARKLRTMHRARAGDGEGFALITSNPTIEHAVQLDLKLLECDRVHSPDILSDANNIDGVILDDDGNVVRYQVLDAHPGGSEYGVLEQASGVAARFVLHWFRRERPEQHRGVPEILSSLPLWALLRRYRLAVAEASEFAASVSGLLTTDAPPTSEEEDFETFDAVETERNMIVVAPHQWKLQQMAAEQPTTSFGEYTKAILTESGRPLCMARNTATGDSSDYNYASGRLDKQSYFTAIRVIQADMGDEVVDPLFYQWLPEARNVFGWAIDAEPEHEWFWDQPEHVDPVKESRARTDGLQSGTTTLPTEYARQGKDWETELRKGAEALGVTLEEYQKLIRQKLFNTKNGAAAAEARWVEEAIEDALQK